MHLHVKYLQFFDIIITRIEFLVEYSSIILKVHYGLDAPGNMGNQIGVLKSI